MSLESSFVNIADLNKLWPTGTDGKNQGDDHLRGVKTVLLNDFAGFTGAVLVTGTDGGAANVYTLTPTNAVVAYTTRMLAEFTPNANNTGASTINISGLGAKDVKSVSGAALASGDLVAGSIYLAIYNGTEFRLLGPTKNYVDQTAFSTALPAQALGLLLSNGSVASFTKSLTFGLNEAKAADVASAASPDIWAGNGNTLHITGTTTLTGFAAAPQAGAWRKLYFDGACLLTNGANFNVQGGANYTTAAGDIVFVYADTTTKFYLSIFPANGRAIVATTYALTLLATLTPTAAANVDFLTTFSATYDNYLILAEGLTNNSGSDDALRMRLAVAGVADGGANYYDTSGAANQITAATQVLGTGNGTGANFKAVVINVNDATRIKSVSTKGKSQSAEGPVAYITTETDMAYSALNAVTGFRLYWSAGSNFGATGKVRVYGYHNS